MSRTSQATIDRIRKAAQVDPDLPRVDLARRFGVSEDTVRRALQNGAAKPGGLKFRVGTSVKVRDVDGHGSAARTGVVIDDALPFPWRDHRRISFDPVPGKVATDLVPVLDLVEIKPSERPESARPREQVELFNAGGES